VKQTVISSCLDIVYIICSILLTKVYEIVLMWDVTCDVITEPGQAGWKILIVSSGLVLRHVYSTRSFQLRSAVLIDRAVTDCVNVEL